MVPLDDRDRILTEAQLLDQKLDFSAAYMALQYLCTRMETFPDSITETTLDALIFLIESDRFDSQKQVLFLYAEAALALIRMAQNIRVPVAERIIPQLQEILVTARGKRQRAVAQALAKLPVRLRIQPNLPEVASPPLTISLENLLACFPDHDPLSGKWQGRSLTVRTRDKGVGTIKFANSETNLAELTNEILWMDFLQSYPISPLSGFHVPCPVKVKGRFLFEINPISDSLLNDKPACFMPVAIAYYAQARYFEYPNENVVENNFSNDQIKEIFFRNAHLLGNLTARGIIHTALIPLFHNRVQQGRRNDNGAYLWEQGGRLDQWLDSCQYPNFAASGLRDFEHLIRMDDSKSLGHYIGEHILSFVLVIGSYFRNKAPLKRGAKESTGPCDTRDLFDKALFTDL
ncbi:MAG: SidJ-related pseudokinase, partial [Proteobacteria bacterium]|nr:SidJ-related pseudokinase [Pseudomonadota bacterium]